MRTALTVTQMLVRLGGVVLLVTGLLFWTGTFRNLVPLHMLIGLLLVLALWALAALALRAGVRPGLPAAALVWGLVTVWLGLNQTSLLPGPTHLVVEVAHLLVGVVALGLAEALAARARRPQSAGVTSSRAESTIG